MPRSLSINLFHPLNLLKYIYLLLLIALSQPIHNLILMNAKPYELADIQSRGSTANKSIDSAHWKIRNALQEQRLHLKRKLFGEHYNYSKVGLNKEKKYLLQEQKNTQIERKNLILLQKIQKIANRGSVVDPSLRFSIQEQEDFLHKEVKTRPINTRINQMYLQNKIRESQNISIKEINSSQKSCRVTKKYAFEGVVEIDGQLCEVKTYFQHNQCIISLQTSDLVQRIKVSREKYMEIFNDVLEKKHSNIIKILFFNGKIFQVRAIEQSVIEFETQNELKLPHIDPKRHPAKQKTEGNL